MVLLHSTLAALSIPLVAAHYKFPDLIVDGVQSADWEYVRLTWNHYTSEPATDVTAGAIRCYELDDTIAGQTGIATVSAGSTVGFHADNTMGHPCYFSAYLTPADPSADSNEAGLGETWFKIWEWSPSFSPDTGLVFDSENIVEFNCTIPKSVPSGMRRLNFGLTYVLYRGEQIALHAAGTEGGAQASHRLFYIACAQLNIENGGNGTPSPTVSFPGVYSPTDPGILINIYALPDGFSGYEARKCFEIPSGQMPDDANLRLQLMAPYPQPDAQLSVDEITNEDLHCGGGAPYGCAMMLILFMLIFYALALWDRYLKLKTKESNRLYSKVDPSLVLQKPYLLPEGSNATFPKNHRYAGS
ncbi:glycoside hydrolase family 61 protein [Schizophyllum commune]